MSMSRINLEDSPLESNVQKNGCEELNEDLWAAILSLLPTKELLTVVSLVCKLWKKLAQEALSQMLTVFIGTRRTNIKAPKQKEATTMKQVETLFKDRLCTLRAIAVSTNLSLFDWASLVKEFETCTHLEILDLLLSGDEETWCVTPWRLNGSERYVAPEFKELPASLEVLRVPLYFEIHAQVFSKLKGLKVLNVGYLQWGSVASHLCSLLMLKIRSEIRHRDLAYISKLQHLTHLEISMETPRKRMIELLMNMTKLRRVNLKMDIIECDVSALRHHVSLERLLLCGAAFSDKAWQSIWNLPQLYSLDAQDCFYPHDEPRKIIAPPPALQSCSLQILYLQLDTKQRCNIPALLKALSLKYIWVHSYHDIDLGSLPDLHLLPWARQDCTIEIKTTAFTQYAEVILKEVGFALTSAIEKKSYGHDITVSRAIYGQIQEDPRSHDCFFDDSLINENGICSDKRLFRKYQEYLSQHGEYMGNNGISRIGF